jgi:hypothetical protein
MPELFFFDRDLLNLLPKAQRSKYQALLKKVILPTGRPFFLAENALPDRELDGFCNYLLAPRRASAVASSPASRRRAKSTGKPNLTAMPNATKTASQA